MYVVCFSEKHNLKYSILVIHAPAFSFAVVYISIPHTCSPPQNRLTSLLEQRTLEVSTERTCSHPGNMNAQSNYVRLPSFNVNATLKINKDPFCQRSLIVYSVQLGYYWEKVIVLLTTSVNWYQVVTNSNSHTDDVFVEQLITTRDFYEREFFFSH